MVADDPRDVPGGSPHVIAGLYVLFGVLWIVATDLLTETVFGAAGQTATAQLLKGLFFVGGTGVILFVLLGRRDRQIRASQRTLSIRERTIENAVDPIAAVDGDERYLFANDAYRELHGLSAGDVEGRPLEAVLDGSTYQRVAPLVRRALDGSVATTETSRTHPTKGERIHEVRLFPLLDQEGAVRGVGSTMRDVTDQKSLERELQAEATRYQTLFDSIRDAILVADTDRRIVDCNQAFTDIFGYDLDEIAGEPTDIVYADSEEFESLEETTRESTEDPTGIQTIECETKAGRTFLGEATVSYHRNEEGEITGFIAVVRDVSDRQRQLHQLSLLDTMLRHTVHNDMNVVMGYADVVEREVQGAIDRGELRGSTADRVSDATETIRNRSARLVDTVDEQRTITRLLSDPPPKTDVELHPLIETVVERSRATHPEATIRYAAEADPTVSAVGTVGQAIEEVVENAIRHAERERPTVDITLTTEDDVARVDVRDEGPTIPGMERHVLTGERSISQLYHGSGLGLWRVQLLVQESNGTVEFERAEPDGNVVSIVLPLAEGA